MRCWAARQHSDYLDEGKSTSRRSSSRGLPDLPPGYMQTSLERSRVSVPSVILMR